MPTTRPRLTWTIWPAGSRFRAEAVRKIVKRRCPHHPAAQTTGVCGVFLAQQLMPLLANKGVTVVRQTPRTYEIGGDQPSDPAFAGAARSRSA